MLTRPDTAALVRAVLLDCWPGRLTADLLGDDVPLGEDGLGLDSIEIVETLLVCEERCGARTTQELLEEGPITIGRVVDHFAA